jgi:adenine deaminase
VPASPFESSGASLTPEDIAELLRTEPRAIGLAEMMDYPAVVAGDEDAVAKVAAAGERHIDGHAPGLSGRALNAYLAAGVRSDHECTTYEEALEKRRLGMWIMIRQGSAARNLEALLPLVLEHGTTNCLLCTDDREPHDLQEHGHINDVVPRGGGARLPAGGRRHDGHAQRGQVPPPPRARRRRARLPRRHRRRARPRLVPPRAGVEARPAGRRRRATLADRVVVIARWMRESMHVRELVPADFSVVADGAVRVIGVDAGTIVTRALVGEPLRRDGKACADPGATWRSSP